MKTLLTLVALGGILAAGSVGFLLTARTCPGEAPTGAPTGAAQPAAPIPGSAEITALDGRVGELERLVLGLRADIARLSEDRQRVAVASPAVGSESAAATPVEGSSFTAAERQAIVEVIEADRIRREEERVAEEQRRAEQRILDRAAALARELGLGVADEKRLGDLMIAGAAKRDELFQQMRAGGDFGEDGRTRMREGFTALRDAYQADLTSAFGADLAQQILERTDLGGRRGGDFMGGGPGFGQAGAGPDGGQGRRRSNGDPGGAGGGQ
jgi:hypothetical protein